MRFAVYSLLALAVAASMFPLFQGKFYAVGDTRDIFIPLETFFQQELLAGRLPSWNPDISWGFPVIASAQIGFFYPPLLLTRWLPLPLYLPLNLIAHLMFTAIGTYLFLRKTGRSSSAAYLGAISFTLGAFVFQHLTHLNVIFALAWFPWQLLIVNKLSGTNSGDLASSFAKAMDGHSAAGDAPGAPRPTHRSAAEERRVGVQAKAGPAVATLALLLGIPFLAGQIQIPFLIAAVSAAYFLYLSWQRKQHFTRSIGILILGGVLAFGLAAAQLLPTAELAWHSTRGKDNDFNIERANQYSWPLYHAPAVLFPRFFGNDNTYWGKKLQFEQGFFIGTIPLLLASSAFFSLRDRSLKFFKWLTILSFLLALGSLSPFRLVGFEPSLWIFSGPARWLLFTTFGLSVIAAYGWDKTLPALTKGKWLPWVTGGIAVVIFLANLALFLTPASVFEHPKIRSLISSARSSSISLLSPYTALPVILLASAPLLLKRRAQNTSYSWQLRLNL